MIKGLIIAKETSASMLLDAAVENFAGWETFTGCPDNAGKIFLLEGSVSIWRPFRVGYFLRGSDIIPPGPYFVIGKQERAAS